MLRNEKMRESVVSRNVRFISELAKVFFFLSTAFYWLSLTAVRMMKGAILNIIWTRISTDRSLKLSSSSMVSMQVLMIVS